MGDHAGVSEQLPHPITGELFPSPVPAGEGWPEDPAGPTTPVARTAAQVHRIARSCADSLADLEAAVSVCRACPRLVSWREEVASTKRASFADQPYWGRPIAGWGDPEPGVLIVGLAPAANGGNRTGRVFTGDRSGDWLFASLFRVGLAAQATSDHAGDGQALVGARMVAAVRCAPPGNKPTTVERDTCSPWLDTEIRLLAPSVRVVVALGAYGWDAALKAFRGAGYDVPRPKARFGHGAEVTLTRDGAAGGDGGGVTLLGCYHPSQQNTFTGRLTATMLDELFARARALAARG